MEKNAKIYTFSSLIFLCLLSLSARSLGIIKEAAYLFAFVFPIALSLLLSKENSYKNSFLKLKRKDISLLLPTVLPIIFVIVFTAYLTALIIFSLSGAENTIQKSGSLFKDLISLAILPAILEEALFRYIPLKLFLPYSKKYALIISTLFFALAHLSLFSIFYAAVAGFAFMAVDIATESIIPSVILHLLNNSISLIWSYNQNQNLESVLTALLALFMILSLVALSLNRKKYAAVVKGLFEKEEKSMFPRFLFAFIIPAVIITLTSLPK